MVTALNHVRLFVDEAGVDEAGVDEAGVVEAGVDEAGVSHVEDCRLALETRDFAPPTTPLEASEFMPAEGFAMVRFAPDWSGPSVSFAGHPSPYRQ